MVGVGNIGEIFVTPGCWQILPVELTKHVGHGYRKAGEQFDVGILVGGLHMCGLVARWSNQEISGEICRSANLLESTEVAACTTLKLVTRSPT